MYTLWSCLYVFLHLVKDTMHHNKNMTWLLYLKINISAEYFHAAVALNEQVSVI